MIVGDTAPSFAAKTLPVPFKVEDGNTLHLVVCLLAPRLLTPLLFLPHPIAQLGELTATYTYTYTSI